MLPTLPRARMAPRYDLRSRYARAAGGACLAGANAALPDVRRGLQSWLRLGVPAGKLILGVPWYGFRYPCLAARPPRPPPLPRVPPPHGACAVEAVPFRGSECSDAAGGEVAYVGILPLLDAPGTTESWDADSSTPYLHVCVLVSCI